MSSLNDFLYAGPPFFNDLCTIFLCVRQYQFAFSADIEKVFLHVYLDENDRDATHSLFVTYRFRVILLRATSYPFMLHAALSFHLTQNLTAVSKDILHNLYVDNIVSGDYFTESQSIMNTAGFNLCSWSCASRMKHFRQHKLKLLS